MPFLYNQDMGHAKPTTDTKGRRPIGREGVADPVAQTTRWAKVTADNGDGTYEIDEVDENDDSLSRPHSDVENNGDAALRVNVSYPVYIRNGVFFFCASN